MNSSVFVALIFASLNSLACASQSRPDELQLQNKSFSIYSVSGERRYLIEIDQTDHSFVELMSNHGLPAKSKPQHNETIKPRHVLSQVRQHARNQNYPQALKILEQLIAEHPEQSFLYQLKGGLYLRSGLLQEAREALKLAAHLEPENTTIKRGLTRLERHLASP